jgi:hypothetical protein
VGAGGAAGANAAGAGGTAGAGGAGGAPCLQLLTSSPQITAAMQGLTTSQAEFDHDANGNMLTFQVVAGDTFSTHALVTFKSIDTSNQAPVGTVDDYVVAKPPSAVVSASTAAVAYAGFDGLRAILAAPQTVVAFTGSVSTGSPADGFVLVVGRSDTTQTTTYTLPTTSAPLAGVQSSCGAIIKTLDVLPNQVPGGEHNSTFWAMTSLTFAH